MCRNSRVDMIAVIAESAGHADFLVKIRTFEQIN